jgi:DNA mismatch endonuclease (patch repair protein)
MLLLASGVNMVFNESRGLQGNEQRDESRLDPLSVAERSERMSRVGSKNTKPELIVRRVLWRMGYRYRLHARDLPGSPDIVFRSKKQAIFVHGCFWHRHVCSNGVRIPKSRQEFWVGKLEANRTRDAKNRRRLRRLGWHVLVVWECELANPEKLTNRLHRFLEKRRTDLSTK